MRFERSFEESQIHPSYEVLGQLKETLYDTLHFIEIKLDFKPTSVAPMTRSILAEVRMS